MNRKENCSCKNENYNKTSVSTFFLMGNYNNRFDPKFTNSNIDIRTKVIQNLDTNRVGCNTCENDTKQKKLSIRHKPTPWRMPYNHYRKSYNCNSNNNCIHNEKIIKDTPVDITCCKHTFTHNRLVGKSGVRLANNGGNYNNYLQSSGKLYKQNAFGVLPENKMPDASGVNLYKIGTVNGTVYNKNNETFNNTFCKISNIQPDTPLTLTYEKQKIETTTRKWANPGFNSRTSVSSKNRLQKLKFNTILRGQQKRNGYNNCINGSICSKYQNPGPNTKKFMSLNTDSSSRIMGMKQSCC